MVYYKKLTTLKVTMHLSVNIDDFYKNDGLTTFVDKMCAFLGIPTNRLRVANVRSGSVYVDFHVVSEDSDDDSDSDSSEAELTAMKDKMNSAHASGSLDVGFPVKAITAEVQKSETTTTEAESTPATKTSDTNKAVLVLAVLLPILFIFFMSIVITKLVLRKRQMKNQSKVEPEH